VPGKSRSGVPKAIRSIGSRLQSAGHEVDYAFLEDFPRLATLGRFAQFGFGLAMPGLVRRGRYDVALLHSADGFWYGWLRRCAPRLAQARAVMVSHGLEHRFWELYVEEERRGRLRISARHRIYTTLVRLPQVASSIRTADLMFTMTARERDYVITRGWKESASIRVIPNGVDPGNFAGARPPAVEPRLLFVGPWHWNKGIHHLAEAFGMIGDRIPGACLTLVGPHESEEEIRQLFPFAVRGRVSVHPPVVPAEMAEFYRRHDIFVFPTLFEGDSLALREAMAAAMAIVTTDMFPMKEVLVNEQTALLVPPGDSRSIAEAVSRLLADPVRARRLGDAARRAASNRTWDGVARDVAKALT
jgi:glycosyltransferase involved in cell wall biosynthesis